LADRLRVTRALAVTALAFLSGCGGHELKTVKMRTALDAGRPREAIGFVNGELGVEHDSNQPKDISGDSALLVLDRGTIQQSLTQFKLSQADFQASDKAIDMLDLAHNAGDSIGEYIFSGSAARYVAPPYEKLLINTLNLINYLETQDLSGARVEARRMSIMHRYVRDELKEPNNPILGLGGYLAGFAYEKGGDAEEALRYYDEALEYVPYASLAGPLRELSTRSGYQTARITKAIGQQGGETERPAEEGEILCVVGYGRVPHKIPKRVPIGLAVTMVSGFIHPYQASQANRLAAQGLVTWINYPALAPEQGSLALPTCSVDGKPVLMEEAANVSLAVREQWKKIEGKVILSAITRLIARFAVGKGIQKAGNDSAGAFLASLGVQAALTALDTPDTRSWETLPARVAIGRMRVGPGRHTVAANARGVSREQPVQINDGGWAVVSLQTLR
jgi:tetratricopeptide (TPR) repeat protein